MAPEQLSTAVKEEWSLTREQVTLIESFTAPSDKPVDVAVLAATAGASKTNTVTILVPTPALLDQAGAIVAEWKIKEPSSEEVHGGAVGSHLTAVTLLQKVHKLLKDFTEKEGLLATATALQQKLVAFVTHCVQNPSSDGYAVWDATTISKQVLSIGQDGASTHQHEDLSSEDDYYGQIQLALAYCGRWKSFTCVRSFVHRSRDELTEAIKTSGTTVRINSIRVLYAKLLTQSIKKKYGTDNGYDGVKLVDSNKPYPDLGE